MRAIRLITGLFAGAALAALALPAAAQLELKPNLQPLPPSNLSVGTVYPSGTVLRFASTTWNNGAGPLELRAGEVTASGQNVYQRVFLDNGGYYDRLAGNFVYHPEHGHFHFENFARYSLEPIDVSGTPPPSSKITFCVMDTTKVDATLPGAPRKAVYNVCGDQIQGMSVGWGDTYGATLPGQSIDVTGLPAGTYRLVTEVDPLNEILEQDDADNVSAVRIYLDPAARTVQLIGVEDPGANVQIGSLVPATIQAGNSIPVTISGEGFDSSLSVSFENGSGPTPVVSNVYVENGNTIRAVLTVRSGGPHRVRTFDLRVGPAVLPGALTIFP
jgi:Lysyl oxidase